MSARTVWITRSLPAAKMSAMAWEAAGFQTYIAPLVEIAPPDKMPDPPQPDAILLVTSSYALRFLADFTDQRHWSVMTVGDVSAQTARELGFYNVVSADGNAQDLIELVKQNYSPSSDCEFLYISGSEVKTDVDKILRDSGFCAGRQVYYQNMPKDITPDFNYSAFSHIALYSAMAARALHPVLTGIKSAQIISISSAVDEVVAKYPQHRRLVADHPNEAAMIKAVL